MTLELNAEKIQARAGELLAMTLSEEEASRLARFAELLAKWNATYNLTSITRPEDVLDLHLMDSLALAQCSRDLLSGSKKVLDVGSGGGLPAIPLAIVRPQLEITMVDAVQKKTIFQRQAIALLRLTNIRALHARVEQIKNQCFDVITSRAFASLSDMVRLTAPLLSENGIWLAMKGKHPQDEIDALPENVAVEEIIGIEKLNFDRHLIVLKKISVDGNSV